MIGGLPGAAARSPAETQAVLFEEKSGGACCAIAVAAAPRSPAKAQPRNAPPHDLRNIIFLPWDLTPRRRGLAISQESTILRAASPRDAPMVGRSQPSTR